MKRLASIFTVTLTFWIVLYSPPAFSKESACNWQVYFSPKGGCTEVIVKELGQAKTSILVQAYSFTSARIAKALLDARKRQVKVEVLLDKSQTGKKGGYSPATFLLNQGISVKIDSVHAIAHNKVMVIDGEIVVTGSFNFTKAAEEKNAENLLVIRDRKMASLYTRNWEEHERHSETYAGKGN